MEQKRRYPTHCCRSLCANFDRFEGPTSFAPTRAPMPSSPSRVLVSVLVGNPGRVITYHGSSRPTGAYAFCRSTTHLSADRRRTPTEGFSLVVRSLATGARRTTHKSLIGRDGSRNVPRRLFILSCSHRLAFRSDATGFDNTWPLSATSEFPLKLIRPVWSFMLWRTSE